VPLPIAMPISACLVLLDDNYETIAAAVEEGRRIVHTIRSVVVYLFSSVLNEMMLVGGALALGLPLPLVALQILWINFFSDSFPAIAFAFEKNESGIMYRRASHIFEPSLQWFALGVSFCTSVVLLFAYLIFLRQAYPPHLIQSTVFVSLGLYTLLLAFSVRNLELPHSFKTLFANQALTAGVIIGSVFIFGALYIPGLNTLLQLTPLSVSWVGGACLITAINLGIVEVGKRWYRTTLNQKK
jgi:Ca2+-transporting ATPase